MPFEDTGGEEPVSPELVLVSPSEVARGARSDLALSAIERVRDSRSDGPSAESGRVAKPRVAARRTSRQRVSTRSGVLVAIILVAASGVAVAGWYLWPTKTSDSRVATHSAAVGFVPARTFAWAPAVGARRYAFQMTENGRVVLRAETRAPRFELPASFHFRPGTYRWTVRSVPQRPGGKAVAESTFVLTAAQAARAER
jgi:hypothetical protein